MSPEDRLSKESISTVPMPATIGLGVFALVLSSAGFFIPGLNLSWQDALKIISLFVFGFPLFFFAISFVMNCFGHQVHWRNAVTLGWLLSCVWMLIKMSGNG